MACGVEPTSTARDMVRIPLRNRPAMAPQKKNARVAHPHQPARLGVVHDGLLSCSPPVGQPQEDDEDGSADGDADDCPLMRMGKKKNR